MKLYKKPIITVDSGMAEGIYAASGTNNQRVSITKQTTYNWGASGQCDYLISFDSLSRKNVTIILTFNRSLSAGWCDGIAPALNDNKLTLSWNPAPDYATIHVQANGDINTLDITHSEVSSTLNN